MKVSELGKVDKRHLSNALNLAIECNDSLINAHTDHLMGIIIPEYKANVRRWKREIEIWRGLLAKLRAKL